MHCRPGIISNIRLWNTTLKIILIKWTEEEKNCLVAPFISCYSIIMIIRDPSCEGRWLNYTEYCWGGRLTTNSTYNPPLSPSDWSWELSGEIPSDLASVLNNTLQPLISTLWKLPHKYVDSSLHWKQNTIILPSQSLFSHSSIMLQVLLLPPGVLPCWEVSFVLGQVLDSWTGSSSECRKGDRPYRLLVAPA